MRSLLPLSLGLVLALHGIDAVPMLTGSPAWLEGVSKRPRPIDFHSEFQRLMALPVSSTSPSWISESRPKVGERKLPPGSQEEPEVTSQIGEAVEVGQHSPSPSSDSALSSHEPPPRPSSSSEEVTTPPVLRPKLKSQRLLSDLLGDSQDVSSVSHSAAGGGLKSPKRSESEGSAGGDSSSDVGLSRPSKKTRRLPFGGSLPRVHLNSDWLNARYQLHRDTMHRWHSKCAQAKEHGRRPPPRPEVDYDARLEEMSPDGIRSLVRARIEYMEKRRATSQVKKAQAGRWGSTSGSGSLSSRQA